MKCIRFQELEKMLDKDSRYEPTQAITFLKLRDDGCDKKTALKFSVTPRCKVDGTLKKAGPAQCQTIKPVFKCE